MLTQSLLSLILDPELSTSHLNRTAVIYRDLDRGGKEGGKGGQGGEGGEVGEGWEGGKEGKGG